ncbi:signal peptide peptidase SppA [Methanotorris igneus]|uniref:Signal peptide peptidase SppA, 36K type n=1 Tax=Methanotorris igneus (strain DSM 5666 / JCM 11834 / Kol 5) TaxID=880724 RepID=F6BAV3_METIK|nr:signal peptide peptidase SppA [Methanotorris igneus]AEF97040.1 signal peptide peptidase SppA, 36K type [Methanotorris igneus Kol 5]
MRKLYIAMGFIFILILALVVGGTLILFSDFDFGRGNIAVINIEGPIVLKSEDSGLFGHRKMGALDYIDLLDRAEKDSNIKAILLKINSPGGEVIASEKLARKVKEVAKKKPVVAYIETIGASGAYMVACPADYIIAEKHSIVGSIGVRMDVLHYYGLMKKLGINVTVIKAGKYKDIASPYRPMTEEEREYLEKMINETYMDFVIWVAENRNLTINETLKIANGKIYMGSDAKKVGLVDEVGTEEDAINITAKLANITTPKVVEYKGEDFGLFNVLYSLLYSFGYGIGEGLGEVLVKMDYKPYKTYIMN